MLSECLGDSSMRLGVPFISLRQLGAVGGKLGRPSLPSVEWRTGQSGAPPDSYTVACTVRDCLPNRAQSTVAAPGPLAHRTLSGAPCRPLELPRIARRFCSDLCQHIKKQQKRATSIQFEDPIVFYYNLAYLDHTLPPLGLFLQIKFFFLSLGQTHLFG
jgi:hypothetical protein